MNGFLNQILLITVLGVFPLKLLNLFVRTRTFILYICVCVYKIYI